MKTPSARLQDALAADHVLLGTAGRHAKEELSRIISRKSHDIRTVGCTIWVVNSNKGTPDKIQQFCKETDARYVLFIAPKSSSNKGTSKNERAKSYSHDNQTWTNFESHLGSVTGYIKINTTGLWMDLLEAVNPPFDVDLLQYREYEEPIREIQFQPSDNAIPAVKVASGRVSPARQVVAVGRLASPYAVWLKA